MCDCIFYPSRRLIEFDEPCPDCVDNADWEPFELDYEEEEDGTV